MFCQISFTHTIEICVDHIHKYTIKSSENNTKSHCTEVQSL